MAVVLVCLPACMHFTNHTNDDSVRMQNIAELCECSHAPGSHVAEVARASPACVSVADDGCARTQPLSNDSIRALRSLHARTSAKPTAGNCTSTFDRLHSVHESLSVRFRFQGIDYWLSSTLSQRSCIASASGWLNF